MDRNSKIDVEHYREESNNQSNRDYYDILQLLCDLKKNVFCLFCSYLIYVHVYSYADQWQGCIFLKKSNLIFIYF